MFYYQWQVWCEYSGAYGLKKLSLKINCAMWNKNLSLTRPRYDKRGKIRQMSSNQLVESLWYSMPPETPTPHRAAIQTGIKYRPKISQVHHRLCKHRLTFSGLLHKPANKVAEQKKNRFHSSLYFYLAFYFHSEIWPSVSTGSTKKVSFSILGVTWKGFMYTLSKPLFIRQILCASSINHIFLSKKVCTFSFQTLPASVS